MLPQSIFCLKKKITHKHVYIFCLLNVTEKLTVVASGKELDNVMMCFFLFFKRKEYGV